MNKPHPSHHIAGLASGEQIDDLELEELMIHAMAERFRNGGWCPSCLELVMFSASVILDAKANGGVV